jgi:hypothetical protein
MNSKVDNIAGAVNTNYYGTCDTAAATKAKTVTLSNYDLKTNSTISVKFNNAVPASATLNVNSKGAKAIYYHGAAITANIIKAGKDSKVYRTFLHMVYPCDKSDRPAAHIP